MTIDIDELTEIAKYLVTRVPRIKPAEKQVLINDIVLYLAELMVKYQDSDIFFSKKLLTQLGWNMIRPIKPFRIGTRIKGLTI